MPSAELLAGDIGGTKTHLALFSPGDRRPVREESYSSPEFPGLTPIVERFLGTASACPVAACFGIAGPVVGNRCVTPNLPWVVDGAELSRRFAIPGVELINDLVAMGEGIASLDAGDLALLHPATPDPEGNAALVAAGTGLGLCVLAADGARLRPVASEGGHMDFAPRNDEEIELWRSLHARFGHVSVERALSGPGLYNIYQHLRDDRHGGFAPEQAEIRAAIASGDPGRVIGEAGAAASDPLCAKALELFLSIYGAVAGNMALLALATRGVYLGGGIAPKLLPALRDGRFLAAFLDKGRMRPLLETIPVHVILNEKTPLLGAARHAARLAADLGPESGRGGDLSSHK